MAQGMFDLYADPEEAKRKASLDESYRHAQLNPYEKYGVDAREFEKGAVEGVKNAGRAILGLPQDTSDSDRVKAMNELRQLATTVQPGTKEFYTQAIAILQKYKQVQAAEQMQDRLRELATYDRTATAPVSDIGKLEADRQTALGRYKDDPVAQKRVNDYFDKRAEKLGQPTGDGQTNTTKLLNERDAALAAGNTARAAELDAQYKANLAKAQGAMTESQKAADVRGIRGLEIQEEELQRKKAADAVRAANAKSKAEAAMVTVKSSLDRSIDQARKIDKFAREVIRLIPGNVGSLWNVGSSKWRPGSPQYDLDQALQGMRANIGFKELQDMRNAAKTGGALGQVSDFENKLLQAVQGSLDIGQSEEQMLRHVRDVIIAANESIKKATEAQGSKIELIEQPEGAPAAPVAAPARPAGPRRFKHEEVK